MARTNVFPERIHVKVEETGDLTAYEELHDVVDDDGRLGYYATYRLEKTVRAKKVVEIKEDN